MLIAGPSCAGKSEFIFNLLLRGKEMLLEKPRNIYWFYGSFCSPKSDKTKHISPKIKFSFGIPPEKQVQNFYKDIIILDDLMMEAHKQQTLVTNLFTKTAHHQSCLIIFITQNLFFTRRTQSLNCHFIVLFKNPRDQLQVSTLARQMLPHKSSFIVEAYEHATKFPFGYLFIDLRQTTPDELRIRTHIFNENDLIFYHSSPDL